MAKKKHRLAPRLDFDESELPQEARQRVRGATLGDNIKMSTAGRSSDGKNFRAQLSSCQAFGALWDLRGEDIATRRPLKGMPDFEGFPIMLCLDFQTRECSLFSLNAGLLTCPEDELLHGPSRPAFLRALSEGARRIDSLGFERCEPPKDWSVKSLNPLNVAPTVAEIMRLLVPGSLTLGDAKAWVDACQPLESHAGDLLSKAFALRERALIEDASANPDKIEAPSGSCMCI